eukprot:TRINITY_DN3012_c0_g1_i3.p1 TRINITY_DN3012_c0_g1~~TRINITY_DN3012_c0_g1_i3.p1  ORF type:complete len:592 (-),score=202.60 TRINITY_DN3012_c0_g1_i3:270-2045(-)
MYPTYPRNPMCDYLHMETVDAVSELYREKMQNNEMYYKHSMLESDLGDADKALGKLNKLLQNERENFKNALRKKEDEIAKLLDDLRKWRDLAEKARADLEAAQREIQRLRDALKAAQDQLRALQDELDAAKSKLRKQEGELEDLRDENAKLKRALDKEKGNGDKLADLMDENARLKKKIKDLEGQIDDLMKQLEDLKRKLRDKEAENADLRDALDRANKALKDKDGKIDDLEKMLNALKKANAELAESEAALKAQLRALRDGNDRDRAKDQDEIARLKKQLADKERENERLKDELDRLKREMEAMKRDMDAMRREQEARDRERDGRDGRGGRGDDSNMYGAGRDNLAGAGGKSAAQLADENRNLRMRIQELEDMLEDMKRRQGMMAQQELDLDLSAEGGIYALLTYIREKLVDIFFEVFTRSADRASKNNANSYVLFMVNLRELKLKGNTGMILSVKTYLTLRGLVRSALPYYAKLHSKKKTDKEIDGMASLPNQNLRHDLEWRNNINMFVEETLTEAQDKAKKEGRRDGASAYDDRESLWLFRLLAILYRVKHPTMGSEYKLETDLKIALEDKIVKYGHKFPLFEFTLLS